MFEAADDRSSEMTHEIAQQKVKRFFCSGNRREEYIATVPTNTIMETFSLTSPATEEKLLGVTASSTVPLAASTACIAGNHGLGPKTRPARRRRHRRRRNLHRHRLSKHRRDQQARCLKRAMGAPRNNNEFLMSQYDEGLILQVQEGPISSSSPKPIHYHQFDCDGLFYSCLTPALVSAAGMDGDLTCSIVTPTRVSPNSCGSSPSDYSSLPSSPDDDSGCHGYRDIFPASCQLRPEQTAEVEARCAGLVVDGTDADFLRRNFEEEYADNITRGLEEASREELISKCIVLMERLRELESDNVSRITKDRPSGSDIVPC